MGVTLTDTSGAMIDLSIPGVVETHPFRDAPGLYLVLDGEDEEEGARSGAQWPH